MFSISVAPKLTFCTILKNTSKTNIILTFLFVDQNSPRGVPKKNVTRLRRNVDGLRNVSYVCGRFNIFIRLFIHVYLSTAARALFIRQTHFSPLIKKMLLAPVSLTILTKRMVRLRCRCSCEMCGTSAVPLLVIYETPLFLSKTTSLFLIEFSKNASSPCPVDRRFC